METNNTNTSVATPLFSWGDYWKTFGVLLVGFFLTVSVGSALHKIYPDIFRNGPWFFLFWGAVLVHPIVMGEALLALIFSRMKYFWGVGIVFLVHAWVHVVLVTFPISLLINGGSDRHGAAILALGMLVCALFLFYSLVRMIRWNILRRKYPEKSFSLTFSKWFLMHVFKIYVIFALCVILAQFLL